MILGNKEISEKSQNYIGTQPCVQSPLEKYFFASALESLMFLSGNFVF